ncbi:MAG: TauD/TfdA family dioxygenase [Alphaproteobacteria bacterium]|nr:TauD/TfdA family dioxygenase [Alphaproteobacteria bacterium]
MNETTGDRLPPDHPAPHDGPIEGPGVWYGPDIEDRDDWAYTLSEAERNEVVAAMRDAKARGLEIGDIAKSDFPLPTLGSKIEELRREVIDGRGFVLLRGFPVEGFSFEEAATMYWGLGTHLGSARSQNTRGHLLGHVTDLGDAFENKSDRGYLTKRHLAFHCDSVDIVALLCLRQAKVGGLSTIVSSYTVHNEMWARRPDLAKLLYGPIARDRRDEIPLGKGPWYELPVFNYCHGRLAVNFLRKHIDTAERHADALRRTPEIEDALDMVYDLAQDPALHLSMDFRPGDIQVLHNHQILHDRTTYEDWPEPERRRYLLRLWLSPPDGLELPAAFAGRYGSTDVGDRGGVIVPRIELKVPLEAV